MASSLLLPAAAASRFSPAPLNPQGKCRRPPPLTISTSSSHHDPARIRDLLHAAGHSCHRFPDRGPDGRPEPVDLDKLRTALLHSAVVVSVFCRSRILREDRGQGRMPALLGLEELFERAAPVPGEDLQLVGFGRAVTDGGMTASIYDVAVIPSLQRLGIGRKIVRKIVRFLTNRGVYDISALCTEEERACGFGEDSLGSITMMYKRATSSSNMEENSTVKRAGRMLLLVPELARTQNI
ncbi:hypothetical protein Taro_010823 [Colocasia esculenta]|uniref:N-acetyltransferase domain-containing protein n=1 Tax=Colocasia esculenta TaxID=4460 RepID=A0A843U829_COLES|nr:hypothetical protein [Colocasia esculenta]